MTTNALDRVGSHNKDAATTSAGQATLVEQARAVAQVQAMVVVAQQVPRDVTQATADMKDICGRLAMAQRAFYSVPNRGAGPTVHLARELARIWGNIEYGVHELRRDDAAGESEIQAFAWDLQTNTRSTRTFIVPHARMKGKERQKLTDLGDIYLSNQNIGARAVRECIFTVLPSWYTDEAQVACNSTLQNGEGEPLSERISKMIGAFGQLGVTVKQLEAKAGKRRASWQPGEVVALGISYSSITRGEVSRDEEFPPERVTADEVVPQTAPAPALEQAPPAGDQPDVEEPNEPDWGPVAQPPS